MNNCRNCKHDNPDDYEEYCCSCMGNCQMNWEEAEDVGA